MDSSPAVVDGLVYVGITPGPYLGRNTASVYCLNAATGAPVWSYVTGTNVESSPAVVGGLVYVGSEEDGNIYCLNATTGDLVWSYKTGLWVESSPAVAGSLVYVGSDDGNVYCLNAATGALVWNYTTGNEVDSSPARALRSASQLRYAIEQSWRALVVGIEKMRARYYSKFGPLDSIPVGPATKGGIWFV